MINRKSHKLDSSCCLVIFFFFCSDNLNPTPWPLNLFTTAHPAAVGHEQDDGWTEAAASSSGAADDLTSELLLWLWACQTPANRHTHTHTQPALWLLSSTLILTHTNTHSQCVIFEWDDTMMMFCGEANEKKAIKQDGKNIVLAAKHRQTWGRLLRVLFPLL